MRIRAGGRREPHPMKLAASRSVACATGSVVMECGALSKFQQNCESQCQRQLPVSHGKRLRQRVRRACHRGPRTDQDVRPGPRPRRPGPGGPDGRGARVPRPERRRQVHDDPGAARAAARRRRARCRLLGGDPWADAVALHRRLAYVPGDVDLWPSLTGGEALDLITRLHTGSAAGDRGRAPGRAAEPVRARPDPADPDLLHRQPAQGRAGRGAAGRPRRAGRAGAAGRADGGAGPVDGGGVPRAT